MKSDSKRVVVGLSGGVDSSVTAYMLQQQGYDVIGLFMKNWHDDSVTISKECPWLEDSYDAMLVAEKLGIPFQTVDLSTEYKQRIVDYMFAEYERGRTPNPDVLCNREIKFDVFLNIALPLVGRGGQQQRPILFFVSAQSSTIGQNTVSNWRIDQARGAENRQRTRVGHCRKAGLTRFVLCGKSEFTRVSTATTCR